MLVTLAKTGYATGVDDRERRRRLLRRVPLFANVPASVLDDLAARCVERRYPVGRSLFNEGDEGQGLLVLVRGSVSLDRALARGESQHVAVLSAGEPLGEMALLDGHRRSVTATALEECTALSLSREEFLHAARSSFGLSLSVMQGLSARLREATRRLSERRTSEVIHRVAAELSRAAAGTPFADLGLDQQALAQRVGATRESVNRALRRLREEGAATRCGPRAYRVDATKLAPYLIE